MNTDKLNTALAELETNLRDLTSAREQVSLITNSTDELVGTTKNLLGEIVTLKDSLGNDASNSLNNLSDILENYNKEHALILKNQEEKIADNIKSFDNTTVSVKKSIEDTLAIIKSTNSKQLDDFETSLVNTLNDTKETIDNNLKSFKNITDDLKETTNNTLIEIMNSNNTHYLDFETKLKALLSNSKSDIDSSISGFKQETIALKSNVENDIEEISKLASTTISSQATEITAVLNTIKEITTKQTESQEKFKNDLFDNLDYFNEEVELLKKRQKLFFITIFLFSFASFSYIIYKLLELS